jgi:hypothetical protein
MKWHPQDSGIKQHMSGFDSSAANKSSPAKSQKSWLHVIALSGMENSTDSASSQEVRFQGSAYCIPGWGLDSHE